MVAEDHWICTCGQPNHFNREKCLDCGADRPEDYKERFKAIKKGRSRVSSNARDFLRFD